MELYVCAIVIVGIYFLFQNDIKEPLEIHIEPSSVYAYTALEPQLSIMNGIETLPDK